MLIGGLDQACRWVVVARVASAERVHSCPPCSRGILRKRKAVRFESQSPLDSLLLLPLNLEPDEKRMCSLPDNHVLSWHILRLPHHDLTLDLRCVQGRWDPEDDSVSVEFGIEVGFEVDGVFDFGFPYFVDDGVETEGEVDVGCGTVSASKGGRKERREAREGEREVEDGREGRDVSWKD